MTHDRFRLLLCGRAGALVGLGLNVLAMLGVATSNGLSLAPDVVLAVVYLACWPSWVIGLPSERYFYLDADLFRALAINLMGCSLLGLGIGRALSWRAQE